MAEEKLRVCVAMVTLARDGRNQWWLARVWLNPAQQPAKTEYLCEHDHGSALEALDCNEARAGGEACVPGAVASLFRVVPARTAELLRERARLRKEDEG